tara:strand:- start:20 stop:460 length:441 start_codon:yes stop_codon:yes gene_type:complete
MMSKFEDNGGYYIDGVPYMDCKITGEPVKNVSTDATSVIGDKALMSRMYKMFPEEMEAKTKSYKPTGRPAGWHWMAEFVDKDGNVFHKGKEQPKLKGTLPPTKVKPPKKKTKRRTKDEILVAKYKEKKEILKKELQKQKDFLNHNI